MIIYPQKVPVNCKLRYVISPSNHQVRESMVMSDTIKKNKFGTSDNHMPTKYLI